jgi:hypothetical protein
MARRSSSEVDERRYSLTMAETRNPNGRPAEDAGRSASQAGLSATSGDADPPGGTAQATTPGSNLEKDPDEWTTGDEPMTGAQSSYLKTLSDEAKEPFQEGLSKAEASKRIDALQAKTGRGQS